ncbi:hypothetical protein FQZ97_1012360 [compost metagenome]
MLGAAHHAGFTGARHHAGRGGAHVVFIEVDAHARHVGHQVAFGSRGGRDLDQHPVGSGEQGLARRAGQGRIELLQVVAGGLQQQAVARQCAGDARLGHRLQVDRFGGPAVGHRAAHPRLDHQLGHQTRGALTLVKEHLACQRHTLLGRGEEQAR